MTLRAPYWGDHPHDFPEACREYSGALAAINAPFVGLEKERALSGGAASAASRATAGLVPLKNKSNGASETRDAWPFGSGMVQIDAHARRCKRMGLAVEHSMRLAESGLALRGGFRFSRWFVTLTYRGVDDWSPKHVAEFLQRARMWARRRKFTLKYTWVAELQARGAVHYHVVFWTPKRFAFPKADIKGWWTHGMTQRKPVTGGCSGVMAYLGKYMSKTGPTQAMQLPAGARMHGAGGLDVEDRREIRYRLAPYWVRDELGTAADIRRTLGGWVDRLTGLFLASPWKVMVDGSGLTWAYRVA